MDDEIMGENAGAADRIISEEPTTEEQQSVPLAAIEKIREELREIKQENNSLKSNLKMYSDHYELLRRQQMTEESSKKQQQLFGNDDSEYLTVGQAKKFAEELARQQQSMAQSFQASTAELNFMSANPDYSEVIKNYLVSALQEDPDLEEEIRSAKNPVKLAYKMAKRSSKYLQDKAKEKLSAGGKRSFNKLKEPQSVAAAGSTAPASPQGKYRAMSDQEFRKEMAKNLGVL